MKIVHYLVLSVFFVLTSPLAAQTPDGETKSTPPVTIPVAPVTVTPVPVKPAPAVQPQLLNEFLVFSGRHTQLFGYEDRRYIDTDKGDYLKTTAWFAGLENTFRRLDGLPPQIKNLVLGYGANLYVQDAFSSLDLYAVPSATIPAQTILGNQLDRAGRFQVTLSGYAGLRWDWFEIHGGLSALFKGLYESERKRLAADGTIINAAGRGWVWDNSILVPNLWARAGLVQLPHILFGVARGHYDPTYGSVWSAVEIPLAPEFTLRVGGSFYETASLFVEPELSLAGWLVQLRGGTILNYNSGQFTRVGVLEGLYFSGAAGFRW